MTHTQPTTGSNYDQPNWADDALEVNCPLCDYNLRGLSDPHCPECGYKFAWRDLLDPQRKGHPYLFELYRGSRFVAFWKTAFHGLRPRKFWKTLRADHRVVPERLALYATVVATLCLTAVVAIYLTMNMAQFMAARAYNMYLSTARVGRIYLPASYYWMPYDTSIFQLGLAIGWPVLTFISLMIFQVSMRRAKVNANHVLRCVIYSSDVLVWIALATLVCHAVYAVEIFLNQRGSVYWGFGFRMPRWDEAALALAWATATVVFEYRLVIAYASYLRFRHALATILASQFIVFLIACIGMFRDYVF
ncbi:MAG TPA: hypothetical protein VFC46_01895 [Humisphaera sp.]|nr:hypothetical protein [Humisphaera sp.]